MNYPMTEGNDWDVLRGQLGSLSPKPHHQRIEDAFSLGIPDLSVCWKGLDSWIELKHLATFPARPSTGIRVEFQPEQVPWLMAGQRAGRRVFVLLHVKTHGWYLFNHGFKELKNGTWDIEGFERNYTWAGAHCDAEAILQADHRWQYGDDDD